MVTKGGEEERQQYAERSIQHHHGAVAFQRRDVGSPQGAGKHASAERPNGGGERSRQGVPGKCRGSGPAWHNVGKSRLLDGQKRADLVATRANHADRPGYDQEQEISREGEGQPCANHQYEPATRHAGANWSLLWSDEGYDGVAGQYQSEKQSRWDRIVQGQSGRKPARQTRPRMRTRVKRVERSLASSVRGERSRCSLHEVVFDLIEDAFRRLVVHRKGIAQLFEELALLAGEARGHLDADMDV